MKFSQLIFFTIVLICSFSAIAECQSQRVKIQVLGSGGPELSDGRASSSYLIWLDGKGIVLIDTGSGSSLNYEKSGANLVDLKVIAFTHFHVDHSADFPAFIKASYFTPRTRDLNIFGPEGNDLMPSATEFSQRLFAKKGVFPYLSEYVSTEQTSQFKVVAKNISLNKHQQQTVYRSNDYSMQAIPVHHGPIPALAWRVNIAGCSVTFSGDMSNRFQTLTSLAKGTDILIAHNAIPESQKGAGRSLHMPPSEIGKIAQQANVKKLILSHRMTRTLGREQETLGIIKQFYKGSVVFADDMDYFVPK
ncbi:MAG: MBL fold metallo-hydrolase [Methylomarinum sp.]|nr:MBL fold metallo-hydrolase [Methylomarinum sp.]